MSVLLSLVPLKGNTGGGRYFPHSGYGGLTPVSLHGTVRTRLALDGDRKPLMASKIHVAVRCYESRIGKMGVLQTNVLVDLQTTLWEHPTLAPLADLDLPFRIVIPADTVAYSTCHMHDYRVFWRIEAVIAHAPLSGIGNRQIKAYDIALYRHDHRPQHQLLNNSGHLSNLHYSISTPSHPIGPGDPIPINLSVRPPFVDVMRLSISVDRRTEFHSKQQHPSSSSEALPLLTPPPTASSVDSATESKSKPKRSSDPSQFAFSHPPPTPIKPNSLSIASLVLEKTDISASNVQSEKDGIWSTEYAPSSPLSLIFPVAKAGHWAIGETLSTPLTTVRFFVNVKVFLSNQEAILLPPQEIFVSSINESKYNQVFSKVNAVSSYRRTTTNTRSDLVERRRKLHPLATSSSPYPASSSSSPAPPSSPSATSSSSMTPTRRSPAIALSLTPPSNDTLPSPPPSPDVAFDSTSALIVPSKSLRRTRGRQHLSVATPPSAWQDKQSEDEDEDFGLILGGDLSFSRPLNPPSSRKQKRAEDEDKAKEEKQKKRSKRSTGVGMGLRTVVAAVRSGVSGGTSATVSAGIAALSQSSSPARSSTSSQESSGSASSFIGLGRPSGFSRRPNTSSGLLSPPPLSRRTQAVPRAGSVGATSPTLVVAMSTMMDDSLGSSGRNRLDESMNICTSEEDDSSPFLFSPPPFEIASPAPVHPATMHAHATASSLGGQDAQLLEWEAELDRIASQSRLKTKNMKLRV
ncbi:hypothetical protein FRC02_003986 [Tulasnella sp. 418]|nr:hypothetical protein FRC02_003986 [Tulasnella sp. 418]